jgi:hypothetical protein
MSGKALVPASGRQLLAHELVHTLQQGGLTFAGQAGGNRLPNP